MATMPIPCATVGCRAGAEAAVMCSFPESRGKTEIAAVCRECAKSYTRRPVLKAAVHPLATATCTGCQRMTIICRHGAATLTADPSGLPHRCRETQ